MAIAEIEHPVLEALDALGIAYVRLEHPPVPTVEAAEAYWAGLEGTHCKNLFLRNYKGNRHYLVIASVSRGIDLKRLAASLGEDRFSFASAARLKRWLGLDPGSVSPFGLINDEAREVRVVCDADLKSSRALVFHPNINTASLEIPLAGFEKFLAWRGNAVIWLEL
ncbi:MAG TPA: prolyl-tRNA synthetase associated domain-containing protein [Candidatus Aminicenantes bacterium]|nr:prolyl-tRNA synthetase associated domain-containing protein [Candidatus Aminicenantes bacterium]HRY65287.1 prolyl-tRNA synthetase associated domain-containing protein [Candidatus Aminicenantes bacterium]HRZ72245.1 prolyl-tRNA synthetase associated domain-containing protein [Candidatus Aminicenantes bacterium]